MPTKRLTQTEYAEHKGVSRKTVSRWLQADRIKLDKNGKIDPADADLRLAATDRSSQSPRNRQGEPEVSSGGVSPRVRSGDPETLTEAQKEKIITETHIAQLKLEELQGSLVRKEAVAKEVGRLAQEYRDQLLSWPARIAAQMLADLQASGAEGLDQRLLNVTLERYVREHLSELGRVVRPARI
jgi:transcriptional regulator with XRE-family HTH domain